MQITKATMKHSLLAFAIAGSLTATQSVLAYEGGDFVIRAGAAVVDPEENSTEINIGTPSLGNAAGTEVGVDSDVQFGISFSYMLDNDFGVELLAATPFGHNIYGKGVLAGAGKLAKTKHLPPTINLNYYPADTASKFQPYFGIGLNYTTFFDSSVTPTLADEKTIDTLATLTGNAAPGAITSAANTDIELEDSFGIAIQIGFDYRLTDNIGINAAYWRADIDTEAEITTDTNLGQVKANVDVSIDPSVYMIGLSYKF